MQKDEKQKAVQYNFKKQKKNIWTRYSQKNRLKYEGYFEKRI